MVEIEFDDKELRDQLTKLQRASQEYEGYEVGFFENSRYDDGTQVAMVAAANEFGIQFDKTQRKIPSRPFFRNANKKVVKKLVDLLAESLEKSLTYILSKQDMNRLGAAHQGAIQKEIRDLKEPPNAPETIARKGSENPLIASGTMRRSVTYKTIK